MSPAIQHAQRDLSPTFHPDQAGLVGEDHQMCAVAGAVQVQLAYGPARTMTVAAVYATNNTIDR